MKSGLIALVAGLSIGIASSAWAQDASPPARDNAGDGGAGVRSGHITATGATVPNPGASQGAGTTSMDKGIQQQDNKIDSSICKGC